MRPLTAVGCSRLSGTECPLRRLEALGSVVGSICASPSDIA